MKVLITGASGFLGSHIVDACIERGDMVRVLVRASSDISYLKKYDNIEYVPGSVEDGSSLRKAVDGIEAVYHSAARSADWGTRSQFYEANYLGTKNMLDACRAGRVKRLVYVSSPSVVFDYHDENFIDEAQPYPRRYANVYSETKGEAEKLVLTENGAGGLTTVALRPHAIWGPRDRIGFFPQILSQIRAGKFKDLSGGRKILVDLCYVKNAARACILAAESSRAEGRVYFITDNEPQGIREFAARVCALFDLPEPVGSVSPRTAMVAARLIETIWRLPGLAGKKRPPFTRYSVGILTCSTTYSIEAAQRDLGYNPVIDVSTGLRILKEWIDETGGVDEFLKYT
ncbi:MAG: dehydrogenase [Spirochaetae bacterium HGW-Spirochaetae-1]|jgi:nucleoside-diphosphate-sugar epimerase|nr:MAG: dehydrogenase [Spirochaetae bacterium HGW-Spirochaetae-1]